MGFAGNKFTWSNKRWGRHAIRERLDRGIASMNWRIAFPEATIFHLGTVKSDHCPLLLDTWPSNESNPRPFRFVAAWTRDHRCADVVEHAWKKNCNGSMCLRLQRKQQNTKSALKKWNRDVFGHCQKRINDITEQLQKIQHKDCTEENYKFEVMLQSEMNEWLLRSEMLWRQKSREMWLKDGDRNSKFFHLSTLIRRRRNLVDAIKSNSGDWITNKKEIKKVFLSNFIEQFSEEEVDFPSDLENLISPIISTEENESLCSIPTPQEIKKVVFEMYDLKAPGPDGLLALFYKKYWDVVGSDVVKAVTNFFYSGKMFQEINKSLIVLIPKVPQSFFLQSFKVNQPLQCNL